MSDLLHKGRFEPINDSFIVDSIDELQEIDRIQEKYGKPDMDTFMNEIHDSIAAKYCGFTHINVEKHGFDARRKSLNLEEEFDFLEVKTASFGVKTWGATFNDTNQDKADSFKSENVYLALAL